MKEFLWTHNGGRLQFQSACKKSDINWLFLPGGPGLGSEALANLTTILKHKISGAIWHFDLPNDGSNILKDKSISNWRLAIIQAVSAFRKVVLVAHSTLGMYVQMIPELEDLLQGLVLISSAPDASWQKSFHDFYEKNKDPLIVHIEDEYAKNPNNKNLRALLIATAKNCFSTKESLDKGKELIRDLPINHLANEWSAKNFDSDYKAAWVPEIIPTLIMTGSEDLITPLELFNNKQSYIRENILIKKIPEAGHYPWFENPDAIIQAFEEFCAMLIK